MKILTRPIFVGLLLTSSFQCSSLIQFHRQKGFETTRKMFTRIEDQILKQVVNALGEDHWQQVARFIPGKNPRQCRERWKNYLSPTLNTSTFTPQDDYLLIDLVKRHGNRWSFLKDHFPGRSGASLKNRYCLLENRIREYATIQQPSATLRNEEEQNDENLEDFGEDDLFQADESLERISIFDDYF
jgi:hypothetical protein